MASKMKRKILEERSKTKENDDDPDEDEVQNI